MKKGSKMSLASRQKLSKAHAGQAPWNKGKVGIYSKQTLRRMSLAKKHQVRGPLSVLTKKKIGDANRGRKSTPAAIEKNRLAHQGRVHSKETRMKMSEAHRGEKCRWWRGGITPEIRAIRNSMQNRLWREQVFRRDNYTCVLCGENGGRVNADHIKPFATHPLLRFSLKNGRTLCVSCHKTTDTYGKKLKNL